MSRAGSAVDSVDLDVARRDVVRETAGAVVLRTTAVQAVVGEPVAGSGRALAAVVDRVAELVPDLEVRVRAGGGDLRGEGGRRSVHNIRADDLRDGRGARPLVEDAPLGLVVPKV